MTGYEWRDHAACKGKTHLFFGEAHSVCAQRVYAEAATLCAACPVLDQCCEWALAEPRHHGFIAGMSPRQREMARRRQRRAA